MAEADSTSTSAQNSGNIHKPSHAVNFDCGVHPQDRILTRIDAAIAIIDCVTVISALERVPFVPEIRRAVGQGHADGYVVADDSMPAALSHAMELISQVRQLVDIKLQVAK